MAKTIMLHEKTKKKMRPRQRRSREGCSTCRKRKKKCDSKCVPCNNCTRLGLECTKDTRLLWEDDPIRDGIRRRGPSTVPSSRGGTDNRALNPENSSESRLTPHLDNTQTALHLKPMSSFPFDLDAASSILLDHYIQRFSRTYPTFSDPSNPFLCVLIPLSMQSRVVLDALLALSGVQGWADRSEAMENSILRIRHKALQGCRHLIDDLGVPDDIDEASTGVLLIQHEDNRFLYLLATSVLLLLYEKLVCTGLQSATPHLLCFSRLFPNHDIMSQSAMSNDSDSSMRAMALRFLSSIFLYNDLVRATSLRTSTLSNFYLTTNTLSLARPITDTWKYTFPQLIARISAGDTTVTEEEICAWDGGLEWLPSFALLSSFPKGKEDSTIMKFRLPIQDKYLTVDPAYRHLSSFGQAWEGEEQELISELYRIAAVIYRGQCLGQNYYHRADRNNTGNIASWAVQLIQLLPHGSRYENTLLWPIGIVCKELGIEHGSEREYIISRLTSLEQGFFMTHFGRVKNHLIKYWQARDWGLMMEEDEGILIG